MPGTTFLPDAGPLGTILGLVLATAMMLVIAANYAYLARAIPEENGSYSYTKMILGNDHAFLAVWSLALAYLSLLWANETAFVLIGRYLFGHTLQWGFHYSLAGYDVYFGEVLATFIVQLLFGLLTIYADRIVRIIRTVLAFTLFLSVTVLFIGILARGHGAGMLTPGFSVGEGRGTQIWNIAVLAPWLFVGFETVTREVRNIGFSIRRFFVCAAAAILSGMMIYIMLVLISASGVPEAYQAWPDYVADLNHLQGVEGMPVIFNVRNILGSRGVRLLALAIFSALSTSVLGFFHASAKTLVMMADDGLLPKRLAEKDGNAVPKNAVLLIMAISLVIPFVGRTAVGWNADVSTLSVSIVYTYISICTFSNARRTKEKRALVTGVIGIVVSALTFFFLLIPNIFSANALATESYLMLAAWSLAGILYYWIVFRRDKEQRFGKSTIMWVVMLFLLFFSASVWLRLKTQEQLRILDAREIASLLTRNNLVELLLIVIDLFIMFSLFSIMLKREKEIKRGQIQAEENSRAKSVFLFNMSHDIRTPMNAIIGYTTLASKENDIGTIKDYLVKIDNSSQHLLALINDVLEMSRIESGKMDLELVQVDLKKMLLEIEDIFSTQMKAKRIDYHVDTSQVKNSLVFCDRNRLNRVLLNLLSNAYKFTPEDGTVTVSLWEISTGEDGFGSYELRVKDSGIGMTPEFAARVFESFERERTSTVSGIEGTGLGMAITKSIVDLMGGTIEVITAPNAGTEFVVRLKFELVPTHIALEEAAPEPDKEETAAPDFTDMRILLVEDNEINREIATLILQEMGFVVDTAGNGQIALDKISASKPGDYSAILMDIQMPVMNGYEASRAIRALDDPALAGIPIIAITANAFTEDVKAAKEAGMNGHVAKPIDITNLYNTLCEILKG